MEELVMIDLLALARSVGGITFPYPVMLGGGVVKTAEQVRALAKTDVVCEWGSIETEPSAGNGGRDYHAEYREVSENRVLQWTQNSKGIPGPGMKYVEKYAQDLIMLYEDHGKPLHFNGSGKGVDDTLSLMKRAIGCRFPVMTVNGACPNKANQPILCDDTDAVAELFERAETEIGKTNTVFLWKVSNGMRRPALQFNKTRVIESKVFSGIITGNTVPNTLDYDQDGRTTILTDKNAITRGGMGGPAILPIALDHTAFCADGMPEGKVVIGCGGVSDVQSSLKFFRSGATMVQLVSAYLESGEDPDFVQQLIMDVGEALHPMN
jgi:dihydroorotate dehydrogenase